MKRVIMLTMALAMSITSSKAICAPEAIQMNIIRYQNEKVECTVVDPEQLDLLARLIQAEAGSDWCSDTMQLGVGSVVLNRINHDEFPDTMEEVINQPGQYACVNSGSINKEASDRAYNNAMKLLTDGSILPEDVVFQANFKQGSEVYLHEQNMYFCRR